MEHHRQLMDTTARAIYFRDELLGWSIDHDGSLLIAIPSETCIVIAPKDMETVRSLDRWRMFCISRGMLEPVASQLSDILYQLQTGQCRTISLDTETNIIETNTDENEKQTGTKD